jgi:predicted DNA-binding transcriptional regulator YafY
MYQPTTRLLTILELLQARPQLSAAELARRLEVDARTVRRYVTMLQDMGIPIQAVHGRYGGYRLRPGYKLPPLMFTAEEALAVTLGLLAARWLGLSATAPATEGALAKLERVLPLPVGARIGALRDAIGFTQPPPHSAPAAGDLLLSLSSAVQRQRRIWLRYQAADGAESEREMNPYGLVFHYGRWYLVGLDHRSAELRVFRVDRVLEVQPRGATFQRPPDFDAVEHLTRALADVPRGFEFEVLLETTLAEARWRVPAHVATLTETDGGVLLRTQGDDLRAVARSLVSIGMDVGCAFVVIRPPELRAEVRQLASDLLAMANRAAPEQRATADKTRAPGAMRLRR